MSSIVTHEHYARAEKLLSTNTSKYVFNSRVEPNWLGQTNKFWYLRDLRKGEERGKQFLLVDPELRTCKPAFDHKRLSLALSEVLGQTCDPDNLPFNQFKYVNKENSITFQIETAQWTCDLEEYLCKKVKIVETPDAKGELLSPDGCWAAFTKDYNLFVRSVVTEKILQLTEDGQPYYDYGSPVQSEITLLTNQLNRQKPSPTVIWSPDSKKLLTHRMDQRLVRELYLVQSVLTVEELRPVPHTYRYSMPGDKHIAQAELVICDIEKRTIVPLNTEPLPIHSNSPLTPGLQLAGWSKASDQVYFVRIARDYKSAQFVVADVKNGSTRTPLEEKTDTFLDFDIFHIGDIAPGQGMCNPNIRLLNDAKSFIWHSERDGWSHLYLYDSYTGKLKNRITSGPWVVRRLLELDEQNGFIYFTAGGREIARDPYYQHLYRVRLDGTELTLLTPENAEHIISFSPDLKYFVDTYSRIDLPPISILRAADGRLIRELEQADVEMLLELGYQMPERITVKARDGITDLYGIMVCPAKFDSARKYPMIDYVYGGPQRINTPKIFCGEALMGGLDLLGGAQQFAQLGFVTIILDGLGTPYRHKAFHDVTYGKLEEAAGLADHVTGIRQLAKRYPFIDLDRIGVWGLSGGGYASTRAILLYPDFYKVAVSVSGNHDQRIYMSLWGERYQGEYDLELYRKQDNTTLVDNLKGNLLLVHGEVDDNVHPGHTFRMVDALIKANKDFDLLIMPNRKHSFSLHPYFIRKKWNYFVKHLMGMEPPKDYIIGREERKS
ncbi:DPP IV N-terminal domain-containing protein [Brevibacterium sp. JNUCC-42]|nr:DPP IV N-terminal domain-containing protein [Brevibacterium sp. JNUCC-42]